MTGALTWAKRRAKSASASPGWSQHEQFADETDELAVEVGAALPGRGHGGGHVRRDPLP